MGQTETERTLGALIALVQVLGIVTRELFDSLSLEQQSALELAGIVPVEPEGEIVIEDANPVPAAPAA